MPSVEIENTINVNFGSMTIQKYPEYKDSGVEWIEDVPSHWEVKKFKRVFYEIKKRSNPDLNCGSISFGKVVYKDDEKIPESTKRSYQVVQKGDFLVNPLNLNYDLLSLRIALSDIDVVVSSGYIVLSNSVKLDKTFYKYFLHRFDVAFMKLLGSGVRQTLNWNDIANCDLIFPPLPEQTAIAAFLDRKTALIDQAIDIKQKQIELLKERRQILIHKAVTRGLNPNVKMKDSGVEWIGEIPEGWVVKKLKYILNERNERSSNGDEPLFMMSQVHGLVVRADYHKKAEVAKTAEGNKIVHKNDLVFNKLKAHLGVFFKSTIDFNGIVSPDYAVYYSNGIIDDLKYLELLFRCPEYLKQFICRITGIVEGLMRLYTHDLFDIAIPVPPINEQKEILSFIYSSENKITTAISLKEQEIEKLKEYKATLINSAVTGKIKVC
jgi:type I restriction enzyme S subunit